jgi:hypothetical protein
MLPDWCIFLPISSQPEGALPGTLWNVGVGAAPAGGEQTWLRALGRPWVSVRAHYGALPLMWLDGDRRAVRNRRVQASAGQVPGRTDRGFKTLRRNVERRCRVPLFSGDPGNKPRLLPRCAFRRSASLFSFRGRFTEPTIHAKGFAGGDDACLAEGALQCAPTFSPSSSPTGPAIAGPMTGSGGDP